MGENVRSQRALAARSPAAGEAAALWIRAEIDYLLQHEVSIRPIRSRISYRFRVGGYPAADEAVLAELHRRVRVLEVLLAEIKDEAASSLRPDCDPATLAKLDRSCVDQIDRVAHRPLPEQLQRALRALSDSPPIRHVARELAGERWEELVRERLAYLFEARAAS
jgi:hypothetical protein